MNAARIKQLKAEITAISYQMIEAEGELWYNLNLKLTKLENELAMIQSPYGDDDDERLLDYGD